MADFPELHLDVGAACPCPDCNGQLTIPELENCYCHTMHAPPCSNCTSNELICISKSCGWSTEDCVDTPELIWYTKVHGGSDAKTYYADCPTTHHAFKVESCFCKYFVYVDNTLVETTYYRYLAFQKIHAIYAYAYQKQAGSIPTFPSQPYLYIGDLLCP